MLVKSHICRDHKLTEENNFINKNNVSRALSTLNHHPASLLYSHLLLLRLTDREIKKQNKTKKQKTKQNKTKQQQQQHCVSF
jgi:hypothetical protein